MLQTRTTGDGRFTYRQEGADDRAAIVFLHGIGGGAELFDTQLAVFGREHRAIAWDMPGYGGSSAIAPEGIDGYARALGDFLDRLGVVRPILVGHSIGGMIVQSYLALAIAPVRAAVLAQTSPAFGGKDPRWAEDFVKARFEPLDRGESMADLAEPGVAGMVGEGADPDGVARAKRVMAATPEAAFRASTSAMIGFDRREALAAIAVPTLLVAGSADTNAPAPTMAKMAERIPGARLVTIEGCGHLVMLERPDAFDAALADFIAGLAPV